MFARNKTTLTSLRDKKDLTDFLRGGDGKIKEDTALFVPVALSVNNDKTNGAGGVDWTFSTFDIDRNEAAPPAQRAAAPQNKNKKAKKAGVTGKKRKKAG
jgi:hypothetical protein